MAKKIVGPNKKEVNCIGLKGSVKTPIVLAFNLGNFDKGESLASVIYQKIPSFLWHPASMGYVKNPFVSMAALSASDKGSVSLQVSDFHDYGSLSKLKSEVDSIWLPEYHLSKKLPYEVAAYYYANHSHLSINETGGKGYFFFLSEGHEFNPRVGKQLVERLLGDEIEKNIDSKEIFAKLQEKYHVFCIYFAKPHERKRIAKKEMGIRDELSQIKWKSIIPYQNVFSMANPYWIGDIIFGTLAVKGGKYDVEGYITQDMGIYRRQDEERKSGVREILSRLEW